MRGSHLVAPQELEGERPPRLESAGEDARGEGLGRRSQGGELIPGDRGVQCRPGTPGTTSGETSSSVSTSMTAPSNAAPSRCPVSGDGSSWRQHRVEAAVAQIAQQRPAVALKDA
jgi:hypothetical protein